ncbi:hypothetical protein TVAG_316240 [Trichomonas vaginalis G3]|uniref:Uncharacterized protein n=1 Tax=Trichomonas vaginalis (strain ATCC PRA-98 / G3) TaxID=412133 RepID=A2FAY2_TRIV3|nr:protein ubiquitination [Trichomonas vaginalis G3]EAX97959.1 hypothetical protein TVAG_316240 [Trichomonas vaginalis G3]KAI5502556.1 protein ubiquitination [Trichomonas vaginalis G3]|eukprot:XP_001310889.1 hypothetical protein [Trichomonas vaginalis G3]
MVRIQLDNSILQRINTYQIHDTVILTVNKKEIELHKSMAIALSQKFCAEYQLNNEISKIQINTDIASQDTYRVLESILQYNIQEIECNETVLTDLAHVGIQLQIKELTDLYKNNIAERLKLDENTCVKMLEFYVGIDDKKKIQECIDFISSHFYKIDESQLSAIAKNFGFDIFEKILGNEKLGILDEDSLARFIFSLVKESESFNPLIEYINFEFCSDEIIDLIDELDDGNNCFNYNKALRHSLKRSKNPNNNNNHFSWWNEIMNKIRTSNFETSYRFLDELTEKGSQTVIPKASKEILDEKKNKYGQTMLNEATTKGNLKLIKALIECGVNIETKDSYGYTPLINAAEKGFLDIVKYYLSIGANIEARNNSGSTALIAAVYNDHLDVVKYLIFAGANIEARDNDGYTSLIVASFCDKIDIVKYLISVGANKEAKKNNGLTSLIAAAYNGNIEVVEYLIKEGANIEAKDNEGWTPLIAASFNDHLEVAQCLIKAGADKLAMDNNGITALSHAKVNVLKYLKTI